MKNKLKSLEELKSVKFDFSKENELSSNESSTLGEVFEDYKMRIKRESKNVFYVTFHADEVEFYHNLSAKQQKEIGLAYEMPRGVFRTIKLSKKQFNNYVSKYYLKCRLRIPHVDIEVPEEFDEAMYAKNDIDLYEDGRDYSKQYIYECKKKIYRMIAKYDYLTIDTIEGWAMMWRQRHKLTKEYIDAYDESSIEADKINSKILNSGY